MRDDVLAIPEHVRDAIWRLESARVAPAEAAGLLVCGVGGSAIGGDLAGAAYGPRLQRPLLTWRGYRLPGWVDGGWAALCSSYSGETEETLACFEAAGELGARRIVATTGGSLADAARAAEGVPVIGLPGILTAPRTAVAYMLVCAAEAAALCGAGPSLRAELEAAADGLQGRLGELRERAAEIAGRIGDAHPVVYGADLTAPVARRWKTQLNENAELASFWAELPEADHNEICGWAGGGRFAAVLLEDADQHPRERRQIEATAEAIAASGAETVRVETVGRSRSERLLWAVMLGDLVSLGVAEARGVDPLPVRAIDELKAALDSP